MIFSDDEEGEEDFNNSKIEFISSLSKEDFPESVKPKETKTDLVIPLKDVKSKDSTTERITTISFESEKESVVVNEATKKKSWGLQVPERKKPTNFNAESSSDLPLLLKNRVIGLADCKSETEKLAKDLKSRPDEPSKESYNKIPVEEFGAAMLRGMGWTGPDSSTVNVIKYVPRPERLGLGASEVTDASELKQRKPVEQSLGIEMSKEEERKLIGVQKQKRKPMEIPRANVMGIDEVVSKRLKIDVEIGSRVIVVGGEHSGLKGYVKAESKDTKFWIIELEINGRDTMIMKSNVKRHDPTSKHQLSSDSPYTNENDLLWTCSGLKVKIKSKSFENGKYYNFKGVILDVNPDKTCTIKLIDTTLTVIHRVPQRTLETCLPRDIDPARPTVKYLKRDRGEEYFQAPFRVLQFDDDRGRAVIQAEDDFQFIFEAHYDDICEYKTL